MPDICMCKGKNCPIKDKCYRHTASPAFWQSWFVGSHYNKKAGECQYFIERRNNKCSKQS